MSEVSPKPNPEEDINVVSALHRQQIEDLVIGRNALQDELAAVKAEHAKEKRSLERLAETDPLTGLANRRALDKALSTAENDPETAVIVFDANDFGLINKRINQTTGDEALKELADIIKQSAASEGMGERVFRREEEEEESEAEDEKHDPVYRRGGDEFVVLAPAEAAERILKAAEETYGIRQYGDIKVSLSGTIGHTFEEADANLQAAKEARKAESAADDPPPYEFRELPR